MTKQELIEKLKGEQQRCDIAGSDMYNYITPSQPGEIAIQCKAQARAYEHAITLAQQLDEPSKEECEFLLITRNEYVTDYQCSNCKRVYCEITYMISNYCPNCGATIKREKSDDN